LSTENGLQVEKKGKNLFVDGEGMTTKKKCSINEKTSLSRG
jgi:hypothetical protein